MLITLEKDNLELAPSTAACSSAPAGTDDKGVGLMEARPDDTDDDAFVISEEIASKGKGAFGRTGQDVTSACCRTSDLFEFCAVLELAFFLDSFTIFVAFIDDTEESSIEDGPDEDNDLLAVALFSVIGRGTVGKLTGFEFPSDSIIPGLDGLIASEDLFVIFWFCEVILVFVLVSAFDTFAS